LLKLFSYNHPVTYILLLGFTFLLRSPSFHPEFFATDESAYLIAAEKIADGGVQYADSWDNKPPILVWFYCGFVYVFGAGGLLAIRIFTCIYVAICAILLNQVIYETRMLSRFSLVPAFLFVLLVSVPWYTQELNGEMLMTLPVILAFYLLVLLSERGEKNTMYLFFAGILLGISIMIKYQAVVLFVCAILALIVIYPPRIAEIFSLLAGGFIAIGTIVLIVSFSGALEEFWEIGVLYNLDYFSLGANPGEDISPIFNLGQYLRLWGGVFAIALIAILHFRINYFKFGIRLRKAETIFFLWMAGCLITILMGSGRLYLHYFILAVPPLVIYFARFFELSIKKWIKFSLAFVAIAMPMVTFSHYLMAAYPGTFSFSDRYLTKDGWTSRWREALNSEGELEIFMKNRKPENGILVLDFQPEIYLQLGQKCATKYTNFSMAFYKMEVFPHHGEYGLVSRSETASDIADSFAVEMPGAIIDTRKFMLFGHLQAALPSLFRVYRKYEVGDYIVYLRE